MNTPAIATNPPPRESDRSVDQYDAMFRDDAASRASRERAYQDLVVRYYDLVTDFYEWGWGASFHFAPRFEGESFALAIQRHEHYLALRLGLEAGTRVLDVGCGVGGPMRAIARLTGARIEGVNSNAGQLVRLARHTAREGLSALCTGVDGDFMHLPMEDARYDAAYAIEATCHAPDRTRVFSEVARVLRPGAHFGGYEWVLTPRYDERDPHHRALALRICRGNGLPKLTHEGDVRAALARAGFVVDEMRDLALDPGVASPWYAPLAGEGRTPARVSRHPWLRPVVATTLAQAERLRLVPEGTSRVSEILQDGADALVEAGELGIFTPCLFFLATLGSNPAPAAGTTRGAS